jgi:hypothetical protein
MDVESMDVESMDVGSTAVPGGAPVLADIGIPVEQCGQGCH